MTAGNASEDVHLFQRGDFTLASGQKSSWKIECDALTIADWHGLAAMLAPLCGRFDRVMGVPRGGLLLAETLREHAVPDSFRILVVDDVWTTGGSMDRFICDTFAGWTYTPHIGRAVVFARNPTPPDVVALFTMAGHSGSSYGRGGS